MTPDSDSSTARSEPTKPSNPLLIEPVGPIDWQQLFGNGRPVELEIGCGKGLFLVAAATDRPEHNFLAVEISPKYARWAAERLFRRGLTNARVARADARRFVAELLPPHSVAVVHVYFPDPWWKRRHKKRRVFTLPFVAELARILEDSGELRVATDVEEYFEVITQTVSQESRLDRIPPPAERAPEHDLDYLTNFERKYRKAGRAIYRANYRKKGSGFGVQGSEESRAESQSDKG